MIIFWMRNKKWKCEIKIDNFRKCSIFFQEKNSNNLILKWILFIEIGVIQSIVNDKIEISCDSVDSV